MTNFITNSEGRLYFCIASDRIYQEIKLDSTLDSDGYIHYIKNWTLSDLLNSCISVTVLHATSLKGIQQIMQLFKYCKKITTLNRLTYREIKEGKE